MPPIRTESSYTRANQEGRLLLAIQALKNDAKLSVRRAARIFEVPETTLRERRSGINERATTRANNHKLTQLEEESLEKWIIAMDDRGTAPRHELVREMANLLLSQRGKTSLIRVGKNWVTNYIKRYPELDFCYIHCRDYQRALCDNPKFIQRWFNCVQKIICEYGIYQDNIYNFDETGFAIGLCSTAKVVIYAGYYGRRAKIQSGNCEWITAIETINVSGWVLSSFIVFKAKIYNSVWFSLQIDYSRN